MSIAQACVYRSGTLCTNLVAANHVNVTARDKHKVQWMRM